MGLREHPDLLDLQVVSAWFPYLADTESTAANDPGGNTIRWNNLDHYLATRLYVDWLTRDNFDVSGLFLTLVPPLTITIQVMNLAVTNEVYQMTAPIIQHPDWFEIPVEAVSARTEGTPFKKLQPIALVVTR